MRRLTRALVMIAATVALVVGTAGCSPDVYSGTVIAKQFTAAHTNTWLMPVTNCSGGKNNVCFTSYIPMTDYVPDQYRVTLQDCKLRKKESDECPTEDWNLDPGTYGRLRVGQFYDTGRH